MAYNMFCHHQQTHFLEACFLCHKPLGFNRDIFMYMGITAFCSEECRQEQIEVDDAKERSWNLSSSMRALRKTPSPAQKLPVGSSAASAAANSAVAEALTVS